MAKDPSVQDSVQDSAQETDRLQTNWQMASADPQLEAQSDEQFGEWVKTVEKLSGLPMPAFGARLLWNRGLRSAEALKGFLRAKDYTPASPFAFGEEMEWAVERLVVARDAHQKVAIWGDFDADGVTSTAVLWDGLGQFFTDSEQLSYFIPNRLKASHGLSIVGIEQMAERGVKLIVTCDTGSTNPLEIERANALGMDVIVSDHHTLPAVRPPVVAIVNPRALPADHPMAHLSGVAVAYKLVEALYERLPEVQARPLSELVDLVAIGLIADLVELKGDCRYLAQIGIEQLQTHLQTGEPVRPGVAKLLQLCRRAGDRPTDISFGLGPRINAVSRIYGDASFCIELLTSKDPERCWVLAEKAELANARRKALQNDVLQQVRRQLETSDLSTTGVIVLCDAQWPVGVLGLVAGQVAQQYGKPTILLTLDAPEEASTASEGETLARGSARSVNQIDLYDLVNSQAHLLIGFGGHPFAAGLSLPAKDLPLFAAAINQQYRQKMGSQPSLPTVNADLTVTVADLGRELFQELKLLEPCGMGNPVPKLLIQNCWFEDVWHQKLKDRLGSKVGYIKASFFLCDQSIDGRYDRRFPGLWWGHYKDDLPPGRWDVIAELDYNSHPKRRRYEIRLVDIRPAVDGAEGKDALTVEAGDRWLLDHRISDRISEGIKDISETSLILNECPTQWQELALWRHQSDQTHQPLALAYASPAETNPIYKWETLLGIAKYLSREQMVTTVERLGEKLGVCDRTLSLGLAALEQAGFTVNQSAIDMRIAHAEISSKPLGDISSDEALARFLLAVQEEQFRRRYFYEASVATLERAISTEHER